MSRSDILRKHQKPISFDDLLKELQGKSAAEEDPNNLSLQVLFNDSFMSKHSSFKTFEEFLEKGSFQVKTHEDIANIPDELFDRHIVRETGFDGWKSMLEKATADYTAKQ